MKYLLLTLGVFISMAVNAQFGLYVNGGGNYSMIRATRTQGIENGKGGAGWQVGFGTEYHTEFGYFLYLGANVSSQIFKIDSASTDGHSVVSNFKYTPLFINFPIGIGYQFDLTKDIGFRLYGGVNTQVGVAGNVIRNSSFSSDSIAGGRSAYEKHSIHYGRSRQVASEFKSDLNNTLWGLNIGAGLNFSKSVEVTLMYQEGLTNILPGGDAEPEVYKLRSVSLDLKFFFPRNYYTTKNTR